MNPAIQPSITCATSPATHITATLSDGRIYYVVVSEREGYALVQPDGCSGWAQVCLGNLDVADTDDIETVAAAAIRKAFVRVG